MRILAALCLSMLLALPARAGPLIFAAASTARALDAAIAESGMDVTVSYGASGAIARQIEQGAPADLFLSANPTWMAHLVDLGLVYQWWDAGELALSYAGQFSSEANDHTLRFGLRLRLD